MPFGNCPVNSNILNLVGVEETFCTFLYQKEESCSQNKINKNLIKLEDKCLCI